MLKSKDEREFQRKNRESEINTGSTKMVNRLSLPGHLFFFANFATLRDHLPFLGSPGFC
jgi:hypothetical protein